MGAAGLVGETRESRGRHTPPPIRTWRGGTTIGDGARGEASCGVQDGGQEGTRLEDSPAVQTTQVARRALPEAHARQAAQEDGHGVRRELSRTGGGHPGRPAIR